MLSNIHYTELVIASIDIASGIPKVENLLLRELSLETTRNVTRVRQVVGNSRVGKHWMGFSPSARNFVSAYRDPPLSLTDTLQTATSTDQGALALVRGEDVSASVIATVGECFFNHWLTWGDGFHVTSGNISSFIILLERMPEKNLVLLRELGECLLARRNEAIAFKRNAGKYVGNFNFRGHAWLTRRSDLVLLAGLGVKWQYALAMFEHVQRVLVINEFAGEKSIPEAVRARARPEKPEQVLERRATAAADLLIRAHFEVSREELNFLLYNDTHVRPAYEMNGEQAE